MGNWHPENDLRNVVGRDADEQEALARLNPYSPGRPETEVPGQPTSGRRLHMMWAWLGRLFGRKQDESANEN